MHFISFCVLGASVVNLAGCATSQTDSATGGVELSLYVRDETGSEALYQVNRDGTLGFGGGFDARIDKITWTDAMTSEEIDQLRALLVERNWFATKPASTGQPKEMRYEVTINSPEVRRRFRVKGESPELRPVRELLERVAVRRVEDDLQRLPQPSIQREPWASPATAPATRPQ